MQHFYISFVNIYMQMIVMRREEKPIIKKILKGDNKSFETIIENYKKLVFHIVTRMITNKTDREDICQEVFIKVYQNLPEFRYKSKLSTWIGKITYNTCLNYLTKKNVALNNNLFDNEEKWEEYLKSDISPAGVIEKLDLKNRLEWEISNLPMRHRTLLNLYHLEGLSYQEIGEVMNLPAGTVKSYLFRARQYLKLKLTEKYQLEELL